MAMADRLEPILAARCFVEERFPEALVALCAGSVLRGQATATSDLDLVIVTEREDAPFRASYVALGWPIEAFLHTRESWRWYFSSDVRGGRAPLASMCAEGIVIRDRDGLAEQMKLEARALIAAGPAPLSPEETEDLRYILTDALDDFIGAPSFEEGFFAAAQVAERSVALRLRLENHWTGFGKWIPRTVRQVDPALADALREALDAYRQTGDKQPLCRFADAALMAAGGRLFDGYLRVGRRTPPDDL